MCVHISSLNHKIHCTYCYAINYPNAYLCKEAICMYMYCVCICTYICTCVCICTKQDMLNDETQNNTNGENANNTSNMVCMIVLFTTVHRYLYNTVYKLYCVCTICQYSDMYPCVRMCMRMCVCVCVQLTIRTQADSVVNSIYTRRIPMQRF